MGDRNLPSRDIRTKRLIVSCSVFHLSFSAIVLFEAPWSSGFYKGQPALMIGESLIMYVFYLLPFAVWHLGDALQRHPITIPGIEWLINFRFALSCFVAKMLWGLAYAVDIINVPGAHEFGTLNFYSGYIGAALLGLSAIVAVAKFGVGLFSRIRTIAQQTSSH